MSTFLISSGARGGRVAAVHADGSRGPELELGTMVTLLAVGGGELAAWEPQRHRLTVRALDGGEPRRSPPLTMRALLTRPRGWGRRPSPSLPACG